MDTQDYTHTKNLLHKAQQQCKKTHRRYIGITYAPTAHHNKAISKYRTLYSYTIVNAQPYATYSITLSDLYKTATRMCIGHCYRHSIKQPRLYDIVINRYNGEYQNFGDMVQVTVIGMWQHMQAHAYNGHNTADYMQYKSEVLHSGYKSLNNYCQSIRGINSRIDTAHKTVYIEDITRDGDIINVTGAINRTINHGDKITPVDTLTRVCYNLALIDDMLNAVLPTLTPTQTKVLQLMTLNYSANNINDKLGYSRRNKTAQKHIRAVRKAFAAYLTAHALTFDDFVIINQNYSYTAHDYDILQLLHTLSTDIDN